MKNRTGAAVLQAYRALGSGGAVQRRVGIARRIAFWVLVIPGWMLTALHGGAAAQGSDPPRTPASGIRADSTSVDTTRASHPRREPPPVRIGRILTTRVAAPRPRSRPTQVLAPGHYTLGAASMRHEIGGFEDLMRSVQRLPGVGAPSDLHGEFFVRGSGADANAIFLDGIPIFFPYHILGFNSIFNEGIIESAEFYAGGAPAAFGGATGGILDIRSRTGHAGRRSRAGLSYLSGHLRAEGGWEGGTAALSLRRSYHDKLARLLGDTDTRQIPSFYDAMLRGQWQPHARHRIEAGILVAGDGMLLPSPEASASRYDFLRSGETSSETAGMRFGTDADRLRLSNRLVVASVTWKATLDRSTRLETRAGWVPQRFGFSLRGQNDEFVDIDSRVWVVRQDLAWGRGAHEIRAGGLFFDDRTRRRVSAYAGIVRLRESNSVLHLANLKERYEIDAARRRRDLALYLQDRWRLASPWTLESGVRYERDGLTGQALWSPRLALDWQGGAPWSVRATYGIHHALHDQPMEVRPSATGRPLGAERARAWSVGVQGRWRPGLRAGATAFLKQLRDVVYEVEPARFANGGRARARGIEGWLDGSLGGGAWRVRASYAWTQVRQRDPRAWRRRPDRDSGRPDAVWAAVEEPPYTYRPVEDQPHRADVDLTHTRGRWRLAARVQWASGRPYTPLESIVRTPDEVFGIEARKGTARLPAYRRVDLRIERVLGAGERWRVYADVLNALGTRNVYQYRYDRAYTHLNSVSMLPRLPTLGIEARF